MPNRKNAIIIVQERYNISAVANVVSILALFH